MLQKIVAKRIKEHRKSRNWSQEDLAEKMGISQAEISRIENALTEITVSDIEKFSTIFGVESSMLMK